MRTPGILHGHYDLRRDLASQQGEVGADQNIDLTFGGVFKQLLEGGPVADARASVGEVQVFADDLMRFAELGEKFFSLAVGVELAGISDSEVGDGLFSLVHRVLLFLGLVLGQGGTTTQHSLNR